MHFCVLTMTPQFSSARVLRGAYDKLPAFFVWALLLIVHTWNSSPLRSNLLRLQCTCCTIPTASGRPHGSPLVWACQWPSDGISSWTPLKPQHSNPNRKPYPLANQLWCIDFRTPPTPLIIPHWLPAFFESLMPLKNWCSILARWSKSSLKHSIRFCGIFPSLKQNFIAYRSSKVSDCIFEIHQQWQSGFSRVYSNCCCS